MPIVERSAVERSGPAREDVARAIRVVIVGFGAIAQSKYLPALLKLSSLYEVVTVVNPSEPPRQFAHARFPRAAALPELPEDLSTLGQFDAALLFTPPAVRPSLVDRFLDHGVDVLAEKPLALTSAGAYRLAQKAVERRRLLMVAHTRRFDSEYERLLEELDSSTVTTASAVTLETPWQPVVELAPVAQPLNPVIEFYRPVGRSDGREISAALGTEDDTVLRYYRWVIVEALVHDLDLLAQVLGPARRVEVCRFAERGAGLTAIVRFGAVDSVIQWSLAPNLGRYDQAFQFTAPDGRYTLRYPSPFLPSAPATLTVEVAGIEPTGFRSTTTATSYRDAFLRLLESFAGYVMDRDADARSAFEAARSLRAAEALARAQMQGRPVDIPTDDCACA